MDSLASDLVSLVALVTVGPTMAKLRELRTTTLPGVISRSRQTFDHCFVIAVVRSGAGYAVPIPFVQGLVQIVQAAVIASGAGNAHSVMVMQPMPQSNFPLQIFIQSPWAGRNGPLLIAH